jgi:C-terminal, D2-small domain, of ClpB protein
MRLAALDDSETFSRSTSEAFSSSMKLKNPTACYGISSCRCSMLRASRSPIIALMICRAFYIVCTSNIGSQQLLRPTRLPFTTLERAVISELHGFFRPELIGRFDEKIVFRPLCPDTQREIAWLAITEELARFRERGFDLAVSDEAFEFLVRRGIHKALGARPLKKTVQRFIGDAVREAIKSSAPSSGVLALSPLNDRLMIVQ